MYIGIDLGTSGVKLILTTDAGEIIKTVTKEYELLIPESNWTEQDPNAWYEKTVEGLKELTKHHKEIRGIGFSGQMHGLVLLDKEDNVLRNALLWNDQRTVEEVAYLNEEIGIEKLLSYTGNIALTGLTAPKVLWVKNKEPKLFEKIDKIMLPKDYLAYKLSGVFATDVSDMSGSLFFEVKNRKYSQEMLDILGIKETQLPKVYESYEVVGTLTHTLSEELGLSDVKIIIGGGDQAAGAVGVGIVEDGACSISLGTSGVVFVASDEFKVDDISYLQSYGHSNGRYHVMGVMLNAAGALKWWSESIFEDKDYEAFFEGIEERSTSEEIYFLPYLTGERSPLNDPYAKGAFFGLQLKHNKQDLDGAVIEGVTFALKQSFELIQNLGVNTDTVRITGGGAKSKVWAQMIADIMNVEVVTLEAEEGPAFGAAILTMVGCGMYPSVEDACQKVIRLKDRFKPHKEKIDIYQKKYERFVKIYPKVKDLFQ